MPWGRLVDEGLPGGQAMPTAMVRHVVPIENAAHAFMRAGGRHNADDDALTR